MKAARSTALILASLGLAMAIPAGHASYGIAKSGSDYGSDAAHHSDSFHDAAHGEQKHGQAGYYGNAKASDHMNAAKAAAGSAHDAAGHQEGSDAQYSAAKSDYGKDAKSKTFGFFDYKYVQPQYHMEQFQSDEKHTSKYGADEHAEGAKKHQDGGYHANGYEGYDKAHKAYGGNHKSYQDKDAAEGYKYNDFNRGYGNYDDGHYDRGYNGYGNEYGSRYTPSYNHQAHPQYQGHYAPEAHYRPSHGYGYDYGYNPMFL